jgi:hypothetical protein
MHWASLSGFLAAGAFMLTGAATAGAKPTPYEDANTRVLLCNASASHFLIVYPSDPRAQESGYSETRTLDLRALLKWQGDPEIDMEVRRLPSDHARHSCGAFSIDFTTSFFNANPQGELGAADDIAIFSISAGSAPVEVQMNRYWCPENIQRAASFLTNAASSIEGRVNSETKRPELVLSKFVCDSEDRVRDKVEVQPLVAATAH